KFLFHNPFAVIFSTVSTQRRHSPATEPLLGHWPRSDGGWPRRLSRPNLRSVPDSGDEGRHPAGIGPRFDVAQGRNDRHLRVRRSRLYGRLKSLGAKQLILLADQHADWHRRHLQVGHIVGGVEGAYQAPRVLPRKTVRALRRYGEGQRGEIIEGMDANTI